VRGQGRACQDRTSPCHAERSEASTSHWIPRYARNDNRWSSELLRNQTACVIARARSDRSNPDKTCRSKDGFLAIARNDIACHAERSEASTAHWIPRYARNDKEKARKIAPKVCVTRKVCGMTEKRCLA
jgi:hypothetical protein